jgi:signal transduction histidine kinase
MLEWRLEVLQKVFTYMFAFLAALLLVETSISFRTGQWHALPALTIAVVLQAIAAFARTWSIRARGAVFTAAACAGMGFGLPTLGFGLPIPFIVGAMTLTLLALCIGQRFALCALTALVAIILGAAGYVCFLRAPLPVALGESQAILDPNHFTNWVRVVVVFAAVGVAIIGAVGFLLQRLEEAVKHNGHLFVSLEQASRERIKVLEEREILQAKIRRGNELQVMGLLSATVAHDFNNLLVVILANATFLKTKVPDGAQESIADIEGAAERATDLCRRLLTLAGDRVSQDEVADLNQIVEGELPILRRLVTSQVTLEWRPGPPLWVKCARTEMRQALLNLSANARDAMPNGGRLQISAMLTMRPSAEGGTPRSYACLAIRDTGTGMDAATRDKIFEPFFTTKGKAKGTGLGMTVVSAAVEAQNGLLELETEPGKGTTFSLFFPIVDSAQSQSPADQAILAT